MDDQSETFTRHLVRALFYATDGRARWWLLQANLNDVTNEALAVAVETAREVEASESPKVFDKAFKRIVLKKKRQA
jgi:hypothetical protein